MGYFDANLFSLWSIAFSLFLLMDPLGNVPIFLAVLKNVPAKRQTSIIFRELIIALVLILLFAFVGHKILQFLRISEPALLFSGGIILFIIAIRMIFPPAHDPFKSQTDKEPFLVPLAVPLVAGPSTLAAVMIYSTHLESSWTLIWAIIISWAISAVILLASSGFKKLLKERGLAACERLMGLILTLIAVQMFLEGVDVLIALKK